MKWLKKLFKKRCEHEFSMWGSVIQPYDSFKKQQARRCKNCGLVEMRTFTSEQVTASVVEGSMSEIYHDS